MFVSLKIHFYILKMWELCPLNHKSTNQHGEREYLIKKQTIDFRRQRRILPRKKQKNILKTVRMGKNNETVTYLEAEVILLMKIGTIAFSSRTKRKFSGVDVYLLRY